MNPRNAIPVFFVVGEAAGLPVAEMCALIAMVCFVFASLLIIVGATQPAQRLFGSWAVFLGLALLLPVLAALISHPAVILLTLLTLVVGMLVFGVRGLGSLYATLPERNRRQGHRRSQLAEQVRVVHGELDRDRHQLPRGEGSGDDFGLLERDRR